MIEEKFSEHPKYFDQTGDIVLQANRILFRVHRDVLSQHSEVFKDMFSLASTGNTRGLSTTLSDNDGSLVLHDNPDELALLFAFMYGHPIDHENTKHCLYLALLAHKYDVPSLVVTCKNWITSQLPIDNTLEGYEAVSKYREDRTLIPLLLRTAQLTDIPDVIPWALYMLSVQPDSDYPLFAQSEEDRLTIQSYSGTIQKLRDIRPKLIEWWEEIVSDFVGGDCGADGWDCARGYEYSIEYGELDETAFRVKSGVRDPIRRMWWMVQNSSRIDLCPSCEDDWSDCAIKFLEDVFDDIKEAVRSF